MSEPIRIFCDSLQHEPSFPNTPCRPDSDPPREQPMTPSFARLWFHAVVIPPESMPKVIGADKIEEIAQQLIPYVGKGAYVRIFAGNAMQIGRNSNGYHILDPDGKILATISNCHHDDMRVEPDGYLGDGR